MAGNILVTITSLVAWSGLLFILGCISAVVLYEISHVIGAKARRDRDNKRRHEERRARFRRIING
jgi:hypothetical protein